MYDNQDNYVGIYKLQTTIKPIVPTYSTEAFPLLAFTQLSNNHTNVNSIAI
jgi:hypothetical protein